MGKTVASNGCSISRQISTLILIILGSPRNPGNVLKFVIFCFRAPLTASRASRGHQEASGERFCPPAMVLVSPDLQNHGLATIFSKLNQTGVFQGFQPRNLVNYVVSRIPVVIYNLVPQLRGNLSTRPLEEKPSGLP